MAQYLLKYKQTILIGLINIIMFIIFLSLSKIDPKIPLYFSAWKFETGLFLPYQLISYQFVHADLSHLYFNLLLFVPISIYLEKFFDNYRLIWYYLMTGAFAGLFHLILYQQDLPLVGASGSIWGLSILLIFLHKSKLLKFLIIVGVFVEIWKCFTLHSDGIAHLCHVGGAVAGFLIYFFDKKFLENIKNPSNYS